MSDPDRTQLAAELASHVRKRASDYFPRLADQPLRVRVGKTQRRQFAELCPIDIQTPIETKRVLAKIALPTTEFQGEIANNVIASHFAATPDPLGSEFRAMTSLERHIKQIDDPQLFAVRVLDSAFDDRALLLELADAKSLDRQLVSASRLRGRGRVPALLQSVQRTGVCLRALHEMAPGDRRQSRGATRDELLDWVDGAEALVADDEYGRRIFDAASRRIQRLANQSLPKHLPTCPLHDDFAPRNVLVNAQGQVAIIDMLDEWTGCVWEDIGQFLAAISANKAQALSGGRFFSPSRINALRGAFLAGYYGEAQSPAVEIAIYEALAILTRWAAEHDRLSPASPWKSSLKRMRLAVARRWYAQCVEQCLQRAELASADGRHESCLTPHLAAGGAS